MRLAFVAVFVGLPLAARAQARMPTDRPAPHTAAAPSPIATPPATPLPMLPSVARVCVEADRERVVVIEDVSLPRGDWQSGGLDLYVAFGAPGTPIAMDARLLPALRAEAVRAEAVRAEAVRGEAVRAEAVRAEAVRGEGEASSDEAGERIATETAVEQRPGVQPLLGPPQMAGLVLHIKEAQLRRAYAKTDRVVVRIRSLLRTPRADASGARDLVVRLGVATGLAMTLGRIQVVSLESVPWITQAEASLCGPEASPQALSVALTPKPLARPEDARDHSILPPTAVRHPSDDLCIRWWTRDLQN